MSINKDEQSRVVEQVAKWVETALRGPLKDSYSHSIEIALGTFTVSVEVSRDLSDAEFDEKCKGRRG